MAETEESERIINVLFDQKEIELPNRAGQLHENGNLEKVFKLISNKH